MYDKVNFCLVSLCLQTLAIFNRIERVDTYFKKPTYLIAKLLSAIFFFLARDRTKPFDVLMTWMTDGKQSQDGQKLSLSLHFTKSQGRDRGTKVSS